MFQRIPAQRARSTMPDASENRVEIVLVAKPRHTGDLAQRID